jgi:hypothetical protein
MAHEIVESIDVSLTRAVEGPAWHRLDSNVPEITAAVLREKSFARTLLSGTPEVIINNRPISADDHKAIVDTKNEWVVSVVNKKYAFPADGYGSLVRLLEPLLDQGLVKVVSAGTLRGYQKAYMTCQLDNSLTAAIATGDEIKRYWTLTDALDGKHASHSFTSSVRIVCANTLAAANRDATNRRSIKHSANFEITREGWRDMILAEKARLDQEAEAFRALQRRQVNQQTLDKYLRECFGLDSEVKPTRKMEFALQSHETDPARGTMWGAYNAAQSVLQWYTRGNSAKNAIANLDNMFFGQGVQDNNRFMQLALATA